MPTTVSKMAFSSFTTDFFEEISVLSPLYLVCMSDINCRRCRMLVQMICLTVAGK